MTVPYERFNAVNMTAKFLKEIATDRQKYPRVPKHVREQAFSLLRHYPMEFEMERACKKAPDIFKKNYP